MNRQDAKSAKEWESRQSKAIVAKPAASFGGWGFGDYARSAGQFQSLSMATCVAGSRLGRLPQILCCRFDETPTFGKQLPGILGRDFE